MFQNYEEKKREHARALKEKRQAQPKKIQAWIDDVEKSIRAQAAPIIARRDKRIADIRKQMAVRDADRRKIIAEIDQARANLANIPVDSEPSDIAAWSVIVEKWPARMAAARDQLNALQQQINAVEREANAELQQLQGKTNREFIDVARALEHHLIPNVYALKKR